MRGKVEEALMNTINELEALVHWFLHKKIFSSRLDKTFLGAYCTLIQ